MLGFLGKKAARPGKRSAAASFAWYTKSRGGETMTVCQGELGLGAKEARQWQSRHKRK